MNTTPSYYIIAYDLRDADKNYSGVNTRIKRLGESKHILYSTWIVKTEKKIPEIFAWVRPTLDKDDNIFIAKIDIVSCAGRLSDEAKKWIKAQKTKLALLKVIKASTSKSRSH